MVLLLPTPSLPCLNLTNDDTASRSSEPGGEPREGGPWTSRVWSEPGGGGDPPEAGPGHAADPGPRAVEREDHALLSGDQRQGQDAADVP